MEVMKGVLKRLSYKPNWRFACDLDIRTWQTTVVAYMKVQDATGMIPGEIEVCSQRRFHEEEISTEERCLFVLRHLISDLEHHEQDEWLKLDGQLLRPPHPKE
jgi:hypothetical protein